MDAVKFIKAMDRMCKSHPCCSDCPLGMQNNKMNVTCDDFIPTYAEETVAVVEKWLAKHPVKTIAEDFLEKYPNAPKDETYPELPDFCPMILGFQPPINGCARTLCTECWGREVE